MSEYPLSIDVYVDKTSADYISSSDPNKAYAGIETTQGFIGGSGKPQSWNTTMVTLLRKYRRGMIVESSGTTLYVRSGEASLEDTNGSLYCFRQNAADVTVTATNLDVGAMAVTNYYIYAYAPSAATTSPIIFSTDSNAPSGIGTSPYMKIGWFDNTASGIMAFTYCGNVKTGSCDVPNIVTASLSGTAIPAGTAFETITAMDVGFLTSGRLVRVFFTAAFDISVATADGAVRVTINGVEKKRYDLNASTGGNSGSIGFEYNEYLAAGAYNIIAEFAERATNGDFTLQEPTLVVKEE